MKRKYIYIIFIAIFMLLLSINNNTYAADLDRILNYEVTVDPRMNDGTLDIIYEITWKVLDSTTEGPLEWVQIGTANSNFDNPTALSKNIRSITNYNGSYVKIVFKDMVLENLLDAFANLLCRVERKQEDKEPKKIVKDRFTVAEKIVSIKSVISKKKHIKFTELFEVDNTKSEMLNIFLALLELLKLQFVKARQSELFGEIDIYENEEKAINE